MWWLLSVIFVLFLLSIHQVVGFHSCFVFCPVEVFLIWLYSRGYCNCPKKVWWSIIAVIHVILDSGGWLSHWKFSTFSLFLYYNLIVWLFLDCTNNWNQELSCFSNCFQQKVKWECSRLESHRLIHHFLFFFCQKCLTYILTFIQVLFNLSYWNINLSILRNFSQLWQRQKF